MSLIHKSLRFKLALWYGLLFAFSSLLMFFIFYYYLKSSIFQKVDQQLKSKLTKLIIKYDKGIETDDDSTVLNEDLIPYDKIPKFVIDSFTGKIKDFEFKKCKLTVVDGKEVYKVVGVAQESLFEIEINKKGEIIELESEHGFRGVGLLKNGNANETSFDGINKTFFYIYNKNYEILAQSDLKFWEELSFTKSEILNASNKFICKTKDVNGREYPIRYIQFKHDDSNILIYGISLETELEFVKKVELTFLYSFIIFLILGCVFGCIISAKGLSGIRQIVNSIQEISKRNFKERIRLINPDTEVESLMVAFNDMAEQIEILIREMDTVIGNVAHDLRTPITRMKNEVEIAYISKNTSESSKRTYEIIMEECDHLSEMIKSTLEITKINSGLQNLKLEKVELKSILMDVVDLFSSYAEDNQIEINMDLAEDFYYVKGNKYYLQRLFSNLLDNAIKYNNKNGYVRIEINIESNYIIVKFKDSGIGIDPHEKEKIFSRFFRGDKSRSTTGYGLGLSIAESIVKIHHGKITVENNLDQGAIFIIKLPKFIDKQ